MSILEPYKLIALHIIMYDATSLRALHGTAYKALQDLKV